MKRQALMTTGMLAVVLLSAGYLVRAADTPCQKPVRVHTGCYGTVVVDTTKATGAALYNYPRFDAAYNTTLKVIKEDDCYYYMEEQEYPNWYWQVAKCPSYNCCRYGCFRQCCYCLGYNVKLMMRAADGTATTELCFYAQLQKANAFFPAVPVAPKTEQALDNRRK